MMHRFKKGTFMLKEGVTDLVAFEEPIRPKLQKIIDWATQEGIGLKFGTSEDNTYLCEYDVVARTNQLCAGYVSELKAMLKELFPKVSMIREWSGTCW